MEMVKVMPYDRRSSITQNYKPEALVDMRAGKVLFVEANKNFVDFLCELLILPIGMVTRLLKTQGEGMVGSIGSLYDSIDKLNEMCIQPNQNKDKILRPCLPSAGNSVTRLLPITGSVAENLYRGSGQKYSACGAYVSNDPKASCPLCQNSMEELASFVQPPETGSYSEEGGYVRGQLIYMIMDDLTVVPMSTISSISTINKCNAKVGDLEEKVTDFTIEEGLKLLKASLQSKNVLTDTFLRK